MAIEQGKLSVDGSLAATYTYIYSFLVKKEHTKAAEALKKAAKDVVVLKDGMSHDDPSLDVIVKEWKQLKAKAKAESSDSSDSDDSSSEDSSSSDSSDSDDDSDSSDSSSSSAAAPTAQTKTILKAIVDEKPKPSPAKVKAKAASPARSSETLASEDSDSSDSSSESSSSDDSSDDEKPTKGKKVEAKVVPKKVDATKVVAKKADAKKAKESSSDSSDSSESSDSSDSDKDEVKDSSSSSSESSDSSDSDDSDDEAKTKKPAAKAKAAAKVSKPKEEPVDVKVTKKRRTDESGASVPTAITETARETESAAPEASGSHVGKEKKVKQPRKSNTPFQRVKAEEVHVDERLRDNTFESRLAQGASISDYGARAARDLIVTRGAGFRKEKNKKKRGSYRGGDITLATHSIKFDD